MANTVTTLNVSNKRVGDGVMRKLCLFPRLHVFIANNNEIGDEGVRIIASNTTIRVLNVTANHLTKRSGNHLARNTTITDLNVSYNKLRDKGAIALARNTTITALRIRFNQVYDKGIVALAACRSIRTLALTELEYPMGMKEDYVPGKMSDDAMDALVNNTCLTELRMEGYKEFTAPIVAKHRSLHILGIEGGICEELAIAISECKTLTSLHARRLETDNAVVLLAKRSNLESIIVSEATIGVEGAAALVENTCLAYMGVIYRLHTSIEAMDVLEDCDGLMDAWHSFEKPCSMKEIVSVNMRCRMAQNKERAMLSSRIFVIVVALAFGLKAAMLKRLRS